tara:strand:- start:124 stop:708 length:585 start_codon:yes stop_codon:yes gene_type:complete
LKNILILSPYPESIIGVMELYGDHYIVHNNSINNNFVKSNKIDFIISYGYKYILKEEIINNFQNKIFNLHISYLPFNKGYYPNLWSHIDSTPSGVSIHEIDRGIDTGKIHFRKKVDIDIKKNTLETSYFILRKEMEKLFKVKWEIIRSGYSYNLIENQRGTSHLKKEGDLVLKKLSSGWHTKLEELIKIRNQFK